jgi:hypothetical protein
MVTALFFDELADVLDRMATVCEQTFVIGDVNIRLNRSDDLLSVSTILTVVDLRFTLLVNQHTT